MKFIIGFIVGVLATLLVLFGYALMSSKNSSEDSTTLASSLTGLSMLKQKGECITKERLVIFQTIESNIALAKVGEFPNELMVLVMNRENIAYYDDQKIKIPAGKCARQIGTYQYETRMGIKKTVPVVVIE